MKKTYAKPKMFAESFELAEHIASCKTSGEGGITLDVNYQNPSSCHYIDNGFALFNAGVSGCPDSYDAESFENVQEYINIMYNGAQCYNAFIDGSFFAS